MSVEVEAVGGGPAAVTMTRWSEVVRTNAWQLAVCFFDVGVLQSAGA
ncbi:hypothetical protein ACWFRK_07360 [Streptomyces sp. NPDC055157]